MFIIFNSMKIIKYLSLLAIVFLSSCSMNSKKKSELIWSKNYPVIGSQSSPRTEDINKDGTLDIVMGAGKNEFQQSDMGILAFDGKSGNSYGNRMHLTRFLVPQLFCDVNGDR